MGLIDQARLDIAQISGDSEGFGVTMIFEAPTGETATITGLHTKHHIGIDDNGNPINSKTARCSFSESFMTAAEYPLRVNGEVKMKGHKVSIADSTGDTKTYIINETFPDETIGFIVCILGTFKQ